MLYKSWILRHSHKASFRYTNHSSKWTPCPWLDFLCSYTQSTMDLGADFCHSRPCLGCYSEPYLNKYSIILYMLGMGHVSGWRQLFEVEWPVWLLAGYFCIDQIQPCVFYHRKSGIFLPIAVTTGNQTWLCNTGTGPSGVYSPCFRRER